MKTKQKMKLRSNKILALFRVFSWDLVFFYSFSVLFLTQIKGFSEAEIMYTSAVIALVPILFQYPFNLLAKKIGPLASVRLGMFCFLAFTAGILIYDNVVLLYLNYCLYAIGAIFLVPNISVLAIKNLKVEGKEGEFSRLEGRGAGVYYIINAVASIGLGYLFDVNAYLTMSFAVMASAVGVILSFVLRDEEKFAGNLPEQALPPKEEEIPQKAKKKTTVSLAMVYLLLISTSFYGLIMLESNIKQLLFQEVLFSATAIGWISFGVSIVKSASCEVFKFFKHKAKLFITIVPLFYLAILLAMAIIFLLVDNLLALQIMVIIVSALFPFFNEPFKIGAKDYIRQTVPEKEQVGAYSNLFVVRNISQLFFSFFIGTLLTGMSLSSSLLYIVAVGGGMYAIAQITYFVIKKVRAKKNSVFLQ